MGFKRLLTVGLMALFCAGTATAASQLNSVQVTPKANAATVTLRTTGSYAHKEYRPDEHLMLVDLTGVTADPAVERTVTLNSAVLKGYKLSSYTSASGSEVTRIELELGDDVGLEVVDRSDGLQILLSSGGIARLLYHGFPCRKFFAFAGSQRRRCQTSAGGDGQDVASGSRNRCAGREEPGGVAGCCCPRASAERPERLAASSRNQHQRAGSRDHSQHQRAARTRYAGRHHQRPKLSPSILTEES